MRPSRDRLPLLAAFVVAGAVAVASRDSTAKTVFDSPYTPAQTFNATLRLVRVDLGLKVLERDPEAGYLLFEYRSAEGGEKPVPGSFELIPSGKAVRVVLQLPQMPRYHEQVLMDALARKLKNEFGDPAGRPDHNPPDGGAGGAEETPP